jgi:hypothetical protein
VCRGRGKTPSQRRFPEELDQHYLSANNNNNGRQQSLGAADLLYLMNSGSNTHAIYSARQCNSIGVCVCAQCKRDPACSGKLTPRPSHTTSRSCLPMNSLFLPTSSLMVCYPQMNTFPRRITLQTSSSISSSQTQLCIYCANLCRSSYESEFFESKQ